MSNWLVNPIVETFYFIPDQIPFVRDMIFSKFVKFEIDFQRFDQCPAQRSRKIPQVPAGPLRLRTKSVTGIATRAKTFLALRFCLNYKLKAGMHTAEE